MEQVTFLKQALSNKNAFKVISGLNNFNLDNVLSIVEAANIGQATYVDICANHKIIKAVKYNTDLPVCASVLSLNSVEESLSAGADLIELGNFDSLYKQGHQVSSSYILHLSKQIKKKYPNYFLCVTVPHTLTLENQITLAKHLEQIGVDLIQTEGSVFALKSYNLINRVSSAFSTLSSTFALSSHINIPIITSSNLSEITVPLAIEYGASGVGIGNSITRLSTINNMVQKIKNLQSNLIISSRTSIDYYNLNPMKLKDTMKLPN
jgi:hypothetical protein